MQENNFEKQVQQRLDELSLQPSEPVWQNIEAVIKKKRERRLIFWLLPFLFLGSAVTWWQLSTLQTKIDKTQADTKKVPSPTTFSKPHITQPDTKTSGEKPVIKKSSEKNLTENVTTLTKDAVPGKNEVTKPTQKQLAAKQTKTKILATRERKAVKENVPVTALTKKEFDYIPEKKSLDTTQRTSEPLAETKKLTKEDTTLKTSALQSDSLQKSIQVIKKDSAARSKLQWSIVSIAGSSNAVERLFENFGNNMRLESRAPNDYSNGGAMPGNNYDTSVRYGPAMPSKGLFFSAGAHLKRRLGKQTALVTGLQYSFYRNHLVVGTHLSLDSLGNANLYSAQAVYRNNGAQNHFSNTLHYIAVPLAFEYGILKNNNLQVQHGFLLGRLLKGDILQYDASTNAYYRRASGLRKNSIHFFTTATYTLFNTNDFSVQAGPHVQWGLQNIFKTPYKRQLVSGGLALQLSF